VALTGKQKAAMLLMSLDAVTATELLKGVNPELVQELAMELAYLDAAGYRSGKQSTQIARQFCNSLQPDEGFHLKSFLKEMLTSTVGDEKTEQIQTQIQDLAQESDPFTRIRFLDSQMIASVLEKEHPRTAAVVLSELPAKKSSDVLDHFGESIRFTTIRRMNTCDNMTKEAKAQIAETVCRRLDAVAADGASEALSARIERSLRKMALILRNIGKKFRDGLFGAKRRKDDKAVETGHDSMTVWEDIPQVADRLLQKALEGVDAKKLALALVGADFALVQKITSNVSETVAAALNEQASHLSDAPKEDVEEAREEIARILRERIE
jgi:flagellar motor switch protein FliG